MAELFGALFQLYAVVLALLALGFLSRFLLDGIGVLIERREERLNKERSERADAFFVFLEEKYKAKERERLKREAQAKAAGGNSPLERACHVLGLPTSHNEQSFRAAYRKAIRKAHPDLGGCVKAAQRVNNAADFIRKQKGWA